MLGISIDKRPDAPVGTPDVRRAVALHWHWTTEYSTEEIAAALGVTERTVEQYLEEPPAEEMREQLADIELEVRFVAVQELKDQLQAAGHRSKTAETPTEVWQDDTGDIHIREVTDDDGETAERVPVPADYELLPDEEARYYARAEVRDIIDQLTDLLGVAEPEQIDVNADVDAQVEHDHDRDLDEATQEIIDDLAGDLEA